MPETPSTSPSRAPPRLPAVGNRALARALRPVQRKVFDSTNTTAGVTTRVHGRIDGTPGIRVEAAGRLLSGGLRGGLTVDVVGPEDFPTAVVGIVQNVAESTSALVFAGPDGERIRVPTRFDPTLPLLDAAEDSYPFYKDESFTWYSSPGSDPLRFLDVPQYTAPSPVYRSELLGGDEDEAPPEPPGTVHVPAVGEAAEVVEEEPLFRLAGGEGTKTFHLWLVIEPPGHDGRVTLDSLVWRVDWAGGGVAESGAVAGGPARTTPPLANEAEEYGPPELIAPAPAPGPAGPLSS